MVKTILEMKSGSEFIHNNIYKFSSSVRGAKNFIYKILFNLENNHWKQGLKCVLWRLQYLVCVAAMAGGRGVTLAPWVGAVAPWEREINFPSSKGVPPFYFSLVLANCVVSPTCYPRGLQLCTLK